MSTTTKTLGQTLNSRRIDEKGDRRTSRFRGLISGNLNEVEGLVRPTLAKLSFWDGLESRLLSLSLKRFSHATRTKQHVFVIPRRFTARNIERHSVAGSRLHHPPGGKTDTLLIYRAFHSCVETSGLCWLLPTTTGQATVYRTLEMAAEEQSTSAEQ